MSTANATAALQVVINNPDSFSQLHKTICGMALELSLKKNKDYANDADFFSNFHDSGEFGILTRLGDKYKRLLNFEKRALVVSPEVDKRFQVSDETVEDTVIDLINYAVLYMAYKRRERKGR